MLKVEIRKRKGFFKSKRFDYIEFPGIKYVKTGKYAGRWELTIEPSSLKSVLKKCKKYRLNIFYYDSNYERSSDYRKEFYKAHPERIAGCRCHYCNKKLMKHEITIDHVISVNRAKKSILTRLLLKMLKIYNINDIKNLIPACKRCNSRKGSKGGCWIIKGYLGRFKIYWILLYLFRTLIIGGFIYILIKAILESV